MYLSASVSMLSERGGLYTSTPEITSSCKRNWDVPRRLEPVLQAGGSCTLMSYFCEGVTGRQRDRVQQSGKARNSAAARSVLGG